jgi:hypothetical protein
MGQLEQEDLQQHAKANMSAWCDTQSYLSLHCNCALHSGCCELGHFGYGFWQSPAILGTMAKSFSQML